MIRLQSLQVVFFTQLKLQNKLEYASKLIEASGSVLDGEPVLLPIPDDAPNDIPRIILKSKDNKFSCNSSFQRLDLFFNPQSADEAVLHGKSGDFFALLLRIASFVRAYEGAKIGRIGIVSTFAIELKAGSNSFFSEKYFKTPSLISNPQAVELSFLEKIDLLSRFKLNRWFRIKSVKALSQPENDKQLNLVIDVNTVPEIQYNLGDNDVSDLFDAAIENMQSLLSSHVGDV